MPVMKPAGTKTAARISAMPITGAVTSSIALIVASRGESPCSMPTSTASTTTIASSTTSPIASTSPSSESVLIEKPSMGKKMNAPISDTGTAISGIKRGAPALQEQEHHYDHEHHRLDQRVHDLRDPLAHRKRGVERDRVAHVGGEAGGHRLHLRLQLSGRLERIRPGRLVDRQDRGRLALEAPDLHVGLRAELDPRHVAQADERAVGVRAHDDLAELLGLDASSLGRDGVGELLPGRRGLGADLPGGVHYVLRLHGVYDVGHRELQLGQRVGAHPDAHRVIRRAEECHLAYAANARQLRAHVDRGVVSQELGVVGAVGRVDRNDQKRQPDRLLHGRAELVHGARQLRGRLRQPVLCEHLVQVDVGADLEADLQRQRAIAAVDRLHVDHLLDAVDLLLDRRGDGRLDRDGIRAGVGGLDLDDRRDDVRVLRDRQAADHDDAADHGDDRDHDRDDRAVDEEAGHRLVPGLFRRSPISTFTSIPLRTFCSPSTITRSPGSSPSRIT